jgi:hypothetical protein
MVIPGGAGGEADVAVALCLLVRALGEVAGDNVIGLFVFAEKIHGHGGKLKGGSALQKQYLMGIRHRQGLFTLALAASKISDTARCGDSSP